MQRRAWRTWHILPSILVRVAKIARVLGSSQFRAGYYVANCSGLFSLNSNKSCPGFLSGKERDGCDESSSGSCAAQVVCLKAVGRESETERERERGTGAAA